SCLALLVCVEAMKILNRPLSDIITVTMPCFGTTKRTKSNAEKLCGILGTTLRIIDISNSVRQHFKDIGHDENDHSVTYENGQARERTLVLMDIANKENGMVIGTGDLSELALGWATYNGDHMSMYGVNSSVPKTLVRHIVYFYADTCGNEELKEVLLDIFNTPVSPELIPPKDGEISQITEDLVGPYELHDFFLYNGIRWAFPPKKVFRLAKIAFNGSFDDQTILKWLKIFYRRFFSQQFKRSCLPDGVKVGSVTLSPRGDWRMPSDAQAALWLSELDEIQI
ncbi:MAG: NAD(+) synthase, partial [Oscillospiraceae bacterium]|nr:NAD(+) synthase [Oscillospiraceae bacterium]